MTETPGSPDPDDSPAWRKAVLSFDATLHQAVKNLTESALQIILVTATEGQLVGTITDGDIRRGLLRGLDLKSPIDTVVQRQAIVAPVEMTRDAAVRLMHTNHITALPVIDDQRRLVDLHLLHEARAARRRKNLMVIMAGGRGSRLGEQTRNCPKPLIKVNNKPMLQHIVERAAAQGLCRMVISLGYLGNMIEEHFGDGAPWKVEIEYLREQHPLGTAGALSLLRPVPAEPFVVTNGDVLTDVDYSGLLDFHIRSGAAATMAVRHHDWKHPFGVVYTKGLDIVRIEEKPVTRTLVNAGIYVLDPAVLEHVPEGEHCDMPAVFERAKDAGLRTIIYPVHDAEAWADFGRPEDFASLQSGG